MAALAGLAANATPALAATHYAAPTGSSANWPCTTTAKPCNLATAIQGPNASERPAVGDTVIIGSGTYGLSNLEITSPTSETIEGAPGESAPQINDDFTSGNAGEIRWAIYMSGGVLRHVDIDVSQTGTNQTTFAATGAFGPEYDDDIFVASAPNSSADAVLLGYGGSIRDSVADASGTDSIAVNALGYPSSSFILRNVTAYATGSGSVAVYAQDINSNSSGPCPTGTMDLSLRNVIADAPGADISGQQFCTGENANFNVDYSDYNPSEHALPTGITATAGTHNINATPHFSDPSLDEFEEDAGSPTIDKGVNDPQDGTTDPNGLPRFLGTAPDIGAYEFPAPYPVTGAATGVSSGGATLNGSVSEEGADKKTVYEFAYGTSSNPNDLLSTTPVPEGSLPAVIAAPSSQQSVSAPLTALAPDTKYYYYLLADNTNGETFGPVQSFTTPPAVVPHAQLTIAFAGSGAGNVDTTPDVGACDTTCGLEVPTGEKITLTASADPGSKFAGWSGGGCTGAITCVVELGANATVNATFTRTSRVRHSNDKPRITAFTLTGITTRKPKLTLTVTAGTTPLRRLAIKLPKDLRFGALRHGLKITPKANVALRHGTLTITVARPATAIRLRLGGKALKVHKARGRRFTLTVTATDTAGTRTELTARI